MIAYLIKMILCSGLLLGAYVLFLETEKTYRLNRFYLLFSIVFSFAVPLIQIRTSTGKLPSLDTPILEPLTPAIDLPYPGDYTQAEQQSAWLPTILLIVYCLITLIFLLRFARNIYRLYTTSAMQKWIGNKTKLVLLNDTTATHSFLNTIFVSKTDYRDDTVEKEILTHELTHVRQKHSLDVLFIELVRSVFWFNPFFILYKRSIQLNHEFLADEAVIKTHQDIPAYQHLLLDKISQQSSNHLSSRLNFLITKKRLAMMKQMKNNTRAIVKTIAVAVLTTGAFILFSQKIIAQKKDTLVLKEERLPLRPVYPEKQTTLTLLSGSGITDEEFNEYSAAVNGAYKKRTAKNGETYLIIDTTGLNIKRLRLLYGNMTVEQQKKAPGLPGLIPALRAPAKKSPSEEQFQSWQDASKYGVWLGKKKIDNKVLANYKASDIVYFNVSKLYGRAKTGKTYDYQVNAYTNSQYEEDFKNWPK
jgi:bla regulator protein blaR1